MCSATVIFENTMALGTILRQRFVYGRGYAADRIPTAQFFKRIVYTGFSFLLPILLIVRLGIATRRKGLSQMYWQAFGWIVVFSFTWSAGELVGYLFGKTKGDEIF